MSLSRKIADAVDALPGGAGDAVAEEGPHRLALRVAAAGPVGLAFDGLDFATSARPEWSVEDLKTWGARLAARISYVMEPLAVLEADALAGEVVLRSARPTLRGGQHAYYELRLGRRGTVHLGRVAFDDGDRLRRPAACQVTREVLERLADDLVASVG